MVKGVAEGKDVVTFGDEAGAECKEGLDVSSAADGGEGDAHGGLR